MTSAIAGRLRFENDGTLTVLSGKVELGQGLRDALTLICSAELSLDPGRIRVLCGDTDLTPNDGVTAGSNSMERTGAAVRDAAVAAREELLRRAAARLQAPVGELEARAGAAAVVKPPTSGSSWTWRWTRHRQRRRVQAATRRGRASPRWCAPATPSCMTCGCREWCMAACCVRRATAGG